MQRIVYLIAYPFLWGVSRLPDWALYQLSDLMYVLIYKVLGYRKKVVSLNLRLCFPEKTEQERLQIQKKFYHHFCDLMLETIKTMGLSRKQMQQKMTFTNKEILQPLIEQKQSFILMCGHYNNYEWLLSLAQEVNCPCFVVYTPITNKYFDRLIKRIRSRFNGFLISRYQTTFTIKNQQQKQQLSIYGLASDQSPYDTPKQYRRSFMGIEVPVFTGAERIAKQFHLPVIFCDIQKLKRGYYQTTFTPITQNPNQLSDYQITDTFTQLLEAQIRRAPEFYFWTHNRFKYRRED